MSSSTAKHRQPLTLVHKFGGTSVADAERYRHVARLLLARDDDQQVTVVSAMKGVTDALIELCGLASRSQVEWRDKWHELRARHRGAVVSLLGEASGPTLEWLDERFDKLAEILAALAVIGELPDEVLQRVQGLGAGLCPAGAAQPEGQCHIGLHTGTQHVRALEQHGLAGCGAGQAHRARAGWHQAVQQAQQRAFAAAVGAHQGHPFTGADVQRDLAQRLHGAKAHIHIAQRKQWRRDQGSTLPTWQKFRVQGGVGRTSGPHALTPRQPPAACRLPPSTCSRQRRTRATSMFSSSTTASSTRPRARARGRSPLLVSRAMAVVITRV